MLLTPGEWQGKGNLVPLGSNTGVAIQCRLDCAADEQGRTLRGELRIAPDTEHEFSVRIAEDDTGLYVIDLRLNGAPLDGSAKLESVPNLGLLWNEAGTVHATFALFTVDRGCGCRGFLKSPDASWTWEMALQPVVHKLKGNNVVSLRRPRR